MYGMDACNCLPACGVYPYHVGVAPSPHINAHFTYVFLMIGYYG